MTLRIVKRPLRALLSLILCAGLASVLGAQEPPPAEPGLDEELLKQLTEEPAAPAGTDPLSTIAGRMLSIVDRLDQSLIDLETRVLQKSVSADLEKLIAEAQQRQQQQQQQQSSQQQQQQQSQRQQVQQPKPGEQSNPQPKQNQPNEPARDSTSRMQRQGAVSAAGQDRQSLLKRVWGHLPAQAREQVQSSSAEQFLPKYELETEQYFRRLAEMEDKR